MSILEISEFMAKRNKKGSKGTQESPWSHRIGTFLWPPQDSHRECTIIRIFLFFNADLFKNCDNQVGLGSVNANDRSIQGNFRFFPNSPDSTASPSFSSPKEEFKISQSPSIVVKPILPQFPSHPGIQELLGRQGVPANDIDQILSTGTRRGRKALAGSGSAPRREDLQMDITSS
jgi:hypothetical protein